MEKALYHAVQFESRPECSKYEAFWLWRIEDVRKDEKKNLPENLYQHLLKKLEDSCFERLSSDQKYDDLREKIKAYIE